MSTRSMIAKQNSDGSFKAIYCHWDGYPSHNGKLLLEHWKDLQKLDELLELGDLSILSQEIGVKVDFDKMIMDSEYQEKHPNQCVAYGRDRGEEDIKASTFKTLEKLIKAANDSLCEFLYVMTLNGRWKYTSCTSFDGNSKLRFLTKSSVKEPV